MNKKMKKVLLAVQRLQAQYAGDVYMTVTCAHFEASGMLIQVYASSDNDVEDGSILRTFTQDRSEPELTRLYNQLTAHLDYLSRCNKKESA
jgi:hypothetical protein